jgi:hypothetical protein
LCAQLCFIPSAWSDNLLSSEINNDTVKLEYKHYSPANHSATSLAVLHHQDDGEIYSLGLAVESAIQHQKNLFGALGGKLYYLDLESMQGAALGLGGHIRYSLPRAPALSLFAEVYHSPQVLSRHDVRHHTDTTLAISYRMLERGALVVGYRNARIQHVSGAKGSLDEGAFMGIRLHL